MKKILPILLLLIVIKSNAQMPRGLPSPSSNGYAKYGYLQTDSAGIAALRDTNWVPKYVGSWVYWQNAGSDSSFWVFNNKSVGKKWDKVVMISQGNISGYVKYTDTALMLSHYFNMAAVNGLLAQKVNYTDTASMLSPYLRSINAITGSGVSGQVTYWNSANSQTGSNDFTWDDTNKNLVVNQNGAGYIKLGQLSGTSGFMQSINSNFLFSSNLRYNGTSWIYNSTGYGAQYQVEGLNGTANISTAVSGTAGSNATLIPRLSVLNSGRVVLGTALPTDDGFSNLSVNSMIRVSNSTATPALLYSVSGNTFLSNNIYYNSGFKYFQGGYGLQLQEDANSGTFAIATTSSGTGGAAASMTNHFFMTNAGRILMGLSLPTDDGSTALQVSGNVSAVKYSGQQSVNTVPSGTDSTFFSATNNGGGYLRLNAYGGSTSGTTFGATNNSLTSLTTSPTGVSAFMIGTTNAIPLVFGINNVERARFHFTTGNLLIGTASDNGLGQLLQVNGGIYAGGYVATQSISGSSSQGAFAYGTLSYADVNHLLTLQSSQNGYTQMEIQNTNTGSAASSDVIVANNNTTASTFYGDFGMNSSGWVGTGAFNSPNTVYLTSTSGDLALGTTTSNAIRFAINGATTDALTIASTGNIVATGTFTASSLIKSGGTSAQALQADGSVKRLESGAYTPTVTAGTNTSSVVTNGAYYSIVGNICTVSYFIGGNCSANVDCLAYISIPTGANFTTSLQGFGSGYTTNNGQIVGCAINNVVGTTTMVVGFHTPVGATTFNFEGTFQYQIQ